MENPLREFSIIVRHVRIHQRFKTEDSLTWWMIVFDDRWRQKWGAYKLTCRFHDGVVSAAFMNESSVYGKCARLVRGWSTFWTQYDIDMSIGCLCDGFANRSGRAQ